MRRFFRRSSAPSTTTLNRVRNQQRIERSTEYTGEYWLWCEGCQKDVAIKRQTVCPECGMKFSDRKQPIPSESKSFLSIRVGEKESA